MAMSSKLGCDFRDIRCQNGYNFQLTVQIQKHPIFLMSLITPSLILLFDKKNVVLPTLLWIILIILWLILLQWIILSASLEKEILGQLEIVQLRYGH